MTRRGRRNAFAFVFLVVNLHLLRNLIGPVYLGLYGVVVAWSIITVLTGQGRDRLTRPGAATVWCLLVPIIGFVSSLAVISLGGAVTGLSRYVFAMPVFLAFVLFTEDTEDLRAHATTMVAFFALACASIPLQLATGPIPWFASASERGGLDRFASLAGSLTSVGIAVGCYIVLASLTRPIMQTLIMPATIISAAMSLSKSAMANAALGLLGILFLGRQKFGRVVTTTGIVLAVIGMAWSFSPDVRERAASTLSSFGIETAAESGPTYDVDAEESIVDRLTVLPRQNFDALADLDSPLVYLTGGGFGMASTALVPAADSLANMAHNQFAELVTVFGIVGAALCLTVLITTWGRLWAQARRGSPTHSAALVAFALLMLNSLFANGTVYQPASASVFYAAMFIAFSARLDIDRAAMPHNDGDKSTGPVTTTNAVAEQR